MRSEEPILVVSGLPRSGTSMMMRMLQVGGIEILSDHIRAADKHNPKGYFELERVKSLHKHHDKSWLEAAQGKAITVVSELLKALPESYSYRMVFMNRDLREIVDSQNKMLATSNAHSVENDQVLPPFRRHLEKIKQWLVGQPHFRVLDVDYHDALRRQSSSLSESKPSSKKSWMSKRWPVKWTLSSIAAGRSCDDPAP